METFGESRGQGTRLCATSLHVSSLQWVGRLPDADISGLPADSSSQPDPAMERAGAIRNFAMRDSTKNSATSAANQ